jgi:hypothetical protein
VNSLITAGADVLARDSENYTPLDLSDFYGCQDMVVALQSTALGVQKLWEMDPKDIRFQTILALRRGTPFGAFSLADVPETCIKELLDHPSTYISCFEHRQMEWISKNGNVTQEVSDDGKPLPSLLHASR